MTIDCQACGAQYRIDEKKIPAGGGFIKCKGCGTSIKLMPPEADAAIPLDGSAAGAEPKTIVTPPDASIAAGDVTLPAPPTFATPPTPVTPVTRPSGAPVPPPSAPRPSGAPMPPPAGLRPMGAPLPPASGASAGPSAKPSPSSAPLPPPASPGPSSAPLPPAASPSLSKAPLPPAASPSPSKAPLSPPASPSKAPLSPSASPSKAPLSPSASPSKAPLSPSASPSKAPLSPSASPNKAPPQAVSPSEAPLPLPGSPSSGPAAVEPILLGDSDDVQDFDDLTPPHGTMAPTASPAAPTPAFLNGVPAARPAPASDPMANAKTAVIQPTLDAGDLPAPSAGRPSDFAGAAEFAAGEDFASPAPLGSSASAFPDDLPGIDDGALPAFEGDTSTAFDSTSLPPLDAGSLPALDQGALPPLDSAAPSDFGGDALPPLDGGALPPLDAAFDDPSTVTTAVTSAEALQASVVTSPGFDTLSDDLPTPAGGEPLTADAFDPVQTDPSRPAYAPQLEAHHGVDAVTWPGQPLQLTDDLPAPQSELDQADLPAPSIELDTDLPTPAAPLDDIDLPRVDTEGDGGGEAKRGAFDGQTSPDLAAPGPAIPAADDAPVIDLPTLNAEAPRLMDEGATEAGVTAVRRPTDVRVAMAKAAAMESTRPQARRTTLALGGLLVALLVGGGVVSWQFPELLPFALPWSPAASKSPEAKEARKQTKEAPSKETAAAGQGAAKDPSAASSTAQAVPGKGANANAVKPPPPPLPPPELTAASVNALPLDVLARSVVAYAATAAAKEPAGQELLWWASYRRARTGDPAAQQELLAAVPTMLAPTLGELGSAAVVGAQLVAKKVPMARANAQRLARGKLKTSGAVHLVLADTFGMKPPLAALKAYERAVKVDPNLLDARLASIELLLGAKNAAQAAQAVELTKALPPSLGAALMLAPKAIDAGAFAVLDLLSPTVHHEALAGLAPAQAALAATLLVRKLTIAGDLGAALAASSARSERDPKNLAAWLDLARLTAAAKGDYAAVLTKAREHLDGPEDDARAAYEQACLALAAADQNAARAMLPVLDGLPPRAALPFRNLLDARLGVEEALAKPRAGATAPVEAALANATRLRPRFPEAKLLSLQLERTFTASGKPMPASAMRALNELTLLARQTKSAEVDVELAAEMARRGNFGGAAELYERALWRDPMPAAPVAVALAWIDALDQGGQAERAQAALSAVRGNRPTDDRVGTLMLAMARRHGDSSTVVEWFRALAAQEPSNTSYKVALATALIDAKKVTDAQAILDALVRAQPDLRSPEVLAALGRAWAGRDSVKARVYLTDSLHLAPRPETYEELGLVEESQAKLDEAIDAYREALKLDPNRRSARLRLARTQLQRGNTKEATEHLRSLVQLNAADAEAGELLGDAMRDQNKPREALAAYNRVLELQPTNAVLLMKVGRVQLQDLGMVPVAMKTLRRVLQLDAGLADAHYYLGYALKDLGHAAEARTALQKYLELKPTGELAAEVKQDLQDLEAGE